MLSNDLLLPTFVALLLIVLGPLLAWRATTNVRRGRITRAGLGFCTGMCCIALALATLGILLNLLSYSRLTYETPIATVELNQIAHQHFQATLILEDGTRQIYELRGDDWQLAARVLKWHGWANLLGLNARYRLERFSGRYRDISNELGLSRTVYALSDDPGVDVWQVAKTYGLRPVDAIYGSANFLPMADEAKFDVRLSQTGLLARPLNDAAETALRNW